MSLKRWYAGEMFAFYRQSGSPNLFQETHLPPEVKLVYLFCACADIVVAKVSDNGVARRKCSRLYRNWETGALTYKIRQILKRK